MNAPSTAPERRVAIENIYPLSPMQEGLLFHTIMAPEAGLYTPQVVLHLTGEIDPDALHAAWGQTVQHHSVLRSGFYWEERDEPFQIVYREASLSWTELDWGDADRKTQAARLNDLLVDNRSAGFDLRRPPLMRVQYLRRGASEHSLVVCYHHLILDGWSAGQLVRETFQLYLREIGATTAALPAPRPYADYIAWLKHQDRQAAQDFWENYLAGTAPVRFLPATTDKSDLARVDWNASAALSEALRGLAQRLGITFNILLQGALGLLIARGTGSSDVMFGATISGRPATLAGSTEMVGLFINTLPVRVRMEPSLPLGAWLIALQTGQALTEQHGHLPLREIQGERGPLFDCLLVFESYPVSTDLGGGASFHLDSVEFDERTHYPLTLMASADHKGLRLTARYDRNALDEAAARGNLEELAMLLEKMAASSQTLLGDLAGEMKPDYQATASSGTMDEKPATAASPASDYIAPSTETERILAAAWAEVLRCPEPGAGDNFFKLGGHSLLAARIVSRLRRHLAIELPVRSLFDRPVLADLAAYIDALKVAARSDPAPNYREIEI